MIEPTSCLQKIMNNMKCYACGSEKETIKQYGEQFCKDCFEDLEIMQNVSHFLEMER